MVKNYVFFLSSKLKAFKETVLDILFESFRIFRCLTIIIACWLHFFYTTCYPFFLGVFTFVVLIIDYAIPGILILAWSFFKFHFQVLVFICNWVQIIDLYNFASLLPRSVIGYVGFLVAGLTIFQDELVLLKIIKTFFKALFFVWYFLLVASAFFFAMNTVAFGLESLFSALLEHCTITTHCMDPQRVPIHFLLDMEDEPAVGVFNVADYSYVERSYIAARGESELSHVAQSANAYTDTLVPLNMSDPEYQLSEYRQKVEAFTDIREQLDLLDSRKKYGTSLRLEKERELEEIPSPFKRDRLGLVNDWLKCQNLEVRGKFTYNEVVHFKQHTFMSFLFQRERFDELKPCIERVLGQVHGSYVATNTFRAPIYNLVNLCQLNWLYMLDHYEDVCMVHGEDINRIVQETNSRSFHDLLYRAKATTRWAYDPRDMSSDDVWWNLKRCHDAFGHIFEQKSTPYKSLQKSIAYPTWDEWCYLQKWYEYRIEPQLNEVPSEPTRWRTRIPTVNLAIFERGLGPPAIKYQWGHGSLPLVSNQHDLSSPMEFLKSSYALATTMKEYERIYSRDSLDKLWRTCDKISNLGELFAEFDPTPEKIDEIHNKLVDLCVDPGFKLQNAISEFDRYGYRIFINTLLEYEIQS